MYRFKFLFFVITGYKNLYFKKTDIQLTFLYFKFVNIIGKHVIDQNEHT